MKIPYDPTKQIARIRLASLLPGLADAQESRWRALRPGDQGVGRA